MRGTVRVMQENARTRTARNDAKTTEGRTQGRSDRSNETQAVGHSYGHSGRAPLPLSIGPVAGFTALVGNRNDPKLIGLNFIDEFERKTPKGQTTDRAAERPASKRECHEEPFDTPDFVQELAAQSGCLTMLEECCGAEFLIGQRAVADSRHFS